MSPPELTTKTVTNALQAGYRHIDSAYWYLYVFTCLYSYNRQYILVHVSTFNPSISVKRIDLRFLRSNEEQVGLAVQNSSLSRSSIYLTTKLGKAEDIPKYLNEGVSKMDPSPDGYVDLFLIHSPSAGPEKRREQWKAMEELVKAGKAKSIGVSN